VATAAGNSINLLNPSERNAISETYWKQMMREPFPVPFSDPMKTIRIPMMLQLPTQHTCSINNGSNCAQRILIGANQPPERNLRHTIVTAKHRSLCLLHITVAPI
jgi:hypothetical protein